MKTVHRYTVALALACSAAAAVPGCSTAPKTEAERQTLAVNADAALKNMMIADPSLQEFLDKAHAYVIFPSVGKGGFIVSGSYGRGEVFRQGQPVGYADISQAGVGLTAGGQSFSELVVFATEKEFNDFADGKEYDFGANASAVALKAGAAASANFDSGVAVFVQPQGGLMADLSLGGQRLRYVPSAGQGRTETTTTTTETRTNGASVEVRETEPATTTDRPAAEVEVNTTDRGVEVETRTNDNPQ